MNNDKSLINLYTYPINVVLKKLLVDKTTGKNIIFATTSYLDKGDIFGPERQITLQHLNGFSSFDVRPRTEKNLDAQALRTKKAAEVFTPSWICNKMNNYCDYEWFGREENLFNTETEDNGWIINKEKIAFTSDKTWKDYVQSTRLEITCGEAPYLVSRYDSATGELIDVVNRIGLLDRKLRVVTENTNTEDEWYKWVLKAYQSCYGYEYQGDSLLIARVNLVYTFVDYYQYVWHKVPDEKQLLKITNIIVWNIWQMNGLTGFVPYSEVKTKKEEDILQLSLFDFGIEIESEEEIEEEYIITGTPCRIYDWRANKSVEYNEEFKGVD